MKDTNKKTKSMEHECDDSDSTSEKGLAAATTATATATAAPAATTTALTRITPIRTALITPTADTTTTTAKSFQKEAKLAPFLNKSDPNVSQQKQTQKEQKNSNKNDDPLGSMKRQEQVRYLVDSINEPGMQAKDEKLTNIAETMESVKRRSQTLQLADAVANPYMHAQQKTQIQKKSEKFTIAEAVDKPGIPATEERLSNIVETMESVKRRQQALQLADAIANPYLHAQQKTQTDKITKKSTIGEAVSDSGMRTTEETLGNIIDSMELVKRHQQDRKFKVLANRDIRSQEEIQSEQSKEDIYPGAFHVGSRLSEMPLFSAIRQRMEGRINRSWMDPLEDDDVISEFSDLPVESYIRANLVPESEPREEGKIAVAEPVQKRLSRKISIVISVIILIVGNLTLGIVYSRKKREKSKDPFITKSDEDDNGKSSTNKNNKRTPFNSEPILQVVKDRGFIRCKPDDLELNQNEGFTLDLCRAIAAAIFDDAVGSNTVRTQFSDVPFGEQFGALWDGTIDVSTAITTHNMVRDVYEPSTGLGIAFSTPFFYSGMIFAGKPFFVDCAERGDSLNGECRGLSVCVLAGTTHVTTITNMLQGVKLHEGAEIVNLIEMLQSDTCDVIGGDVLNLKEQLVRDMGYEGEYSVGSKLFTNEPLTIVSKGDDKEWADFCNWILHALITAEPLDITQETALSSSLWSDATMSGDFPEFSSVFGDEHKNMFRNAIAAVGNYGELYERHYESFAPRITAIINTINYGESGLLYSVPFGNLLIDDSSLLLNVSPPGPIFNGTLESIESRGVLRCGIIGNRPGFALLESNKDVLENRTWTGLDIEYCRAISAALFPKSLDEDVDQDSVIEFVDIDGNEQDGYVALDDDRIDVFVGGSITLSTDIKETMTGKGFMFSLPYFYYDTDDMMSTMFIAKKIGLSLVTRETDSQWSAFVRWISIALIYAEENDIKQEDALDMPVVELFGLNYLQMFRDAVLAVGNYGEMFDRTLILPYNMTRTGRNWINENGEPQLVPMPFI